MYSDKKNILQLVALLIEHGVSNIAGTLRLCTHWQTIRSSIAIP